MKTKLYVLVVALMQEGWTSPAYERLNNYTYTYMRAHAKNAVESLVHEIAHSLILRQMGTPKTAAKTEKMISRKPWTKTLRDEIKVTAITILVCRRLGFESFEASAEDLWRSLIDNAPRNINKKYATGKRDKDAYRMKYLRQLNVQLGIKANARYADKLLAYLRSL